MYELIAVNYQELTPCTSWWNLYTNIFIQYHIYTREILIMIQLFVASAENVL